MSIKLQKIHYENFKCFNSKEIDFDGRDASANGENGKGKTSLADGVFWVLCDQNIEGVTKFGIRPIDTDPASPRFGAPIRGLVVKGVVQLRINGVDKTFRKEQHEVVKEIDGEQRYTYPNKYWIDDYPMPEGKYKSAIEDIIPTEKFKVLTNLGYFNNDDKVKRSKRRKTLIDMAEYRVPQPAGHDDLLKRMDGHDIDDYKKVLTDRKKLLEDEQYDNGVIIGEKEKDLAKYAPDQGDSELELIAKRENVKEILAGQEAKRKILLESETKRQELIDKVNHLTCERGQRESQLKNDTSGQQALYDERAELERKHADRTQELVDLQNEIRQANTTIESVQNDIDQSLQTLGTIRGEYIKAKDKPVDDRCYACGQQLTQANVVENNKKRTSALEAITNSGNKIKDSVDERKRYLLELQNDFNKLNAGQEEMVASLKVAEATKNNRIAEINEAIKNRPEADPKDDSKWQELTARIEKLQSELGEPASKQLEKIEADKTTAEAELQQLNETLNQADNIKDIKARLTELEGRQKELAQLIADANAELDEIGRFKVAQSKLVEAVVNGMFEHVTWRLFEFYQNGEVNDRVCVCLLNGKPYPDLSKGEKVFADNDVINTMGDYYGVEVFRFIDHAESMTMPIEAESQVIALAAIYVYRCVSCCKVTYKQFAKSITKQIPQIVDCEHCGANAERIKELVVEVEQKEEAGKAVV